MYDNKNDDNTDYHINLKYVKLKSFLRHITNLAAKTEYSLNKIFI